MCSMWKERFINGGLNIVNVHMFFILLTHIAEVLCHVRCTASNLFLFT